MKLPTNLMRVMFLATLLACWSHPAAYAWCLLGGEGNARLPQLEARGEWGDASEFSFQLAAFCSATALACWVAGVAREATANKAFSTSPPAPLKRTVSGGSGGAAALPPATPTNGTPISTAKSAPPSVLGGGLAPPHAEEAAKPAGKARSMSGAVPAVSSSSSDFHVLSRRFQSSSRWSTRSAC